MRLWMRKDGTYPAEEVFSAIEAFGEFANTTGLFSRAGYVDLTSLFYWEYRMAAWHSQVVVESDPAFDSVSLYNCRRALELFLSVPDADQKRASVLKALIHSTWPELTSHPVNGEPFWEF